MRLKHLTGTTIAVLAMLVASASACGCDHHADKPVEAAPSCHGRTHGAPAATPLDSDNDRIDVGCECPVLVQDAAVLGKPGGKKAKAQQLSPDATASVDITRPSVFHVTANDTYHSNRDRYDSVRTVYPPSSAPPRL